MLIEDTIREDVDAVDDHEEHSGLSVEQAEAAFKKRWSDPQETEVSKGEDESGSVKDEGDKDAPKEGDTKVDEADPKKSAEEKVEDALEKLADLEAVVKHKVDGVEKTFKVKDLVRLAGQDAAITQRSQEHAKTVAEVKARAEKFDLGIEAMAKHAEAQYREYENLDFIALSKVMSEPELRQLQADASKARENYEFVKGGLDNRRAELANERAAQRAKQVPETIKALTDQASPHFVPDWNDALYDSLRDFAVENGISRAAIDEEVNAPALRVLWMAQQFANTLKKVNTVIPKKDPTTSKRVMAPSNGSDDKGDNSSKARKELRRTGSVDAAAAAFKARWSE